MCVGVPFQHREGSDNRAAIKEALFSAYDLQLKDKIKNELRAIATISTSSAVEPEQAQASQWTTTWWEQFKVLLERGIKERRHESFSGLKFVEVIFIALFSGAMWWRSGDRLDDQVYFTLKVAVTVPKL